jgi:hypothetical protein
LLLLLPPSDEHFELTGDEGPDCGLEEQPLEELDRVDDVTTFGEVLLLSFLTKMPVVVAATVVGG